MEEDMGKKVHDMFVKKQESKLDPFLVHLLMKMKNKVIYQ